MAEPGPTTGRSLDFCVPVPANSAQLLMGSKTGAGCSLKGLRGPRLALAQIHALLLSSFQQMPGDMSVASPPSEQARLCSPMALRCQAQVSLFSVRTGELPGSRAPVLFPFAPLSAAGTVLREGRTGVDGLEMRQWPEFGTFGPPSYGDGGAV